jgi:hypothetical protein
VSHAHWQRGCGPEKYGAVAKKYVDDEFARRDQQQQLDALRQRCLQRLAAASSQLPKAGGAFRTHVNTIGEYDFDKQGLWINVSSVSYDPDSLGASGNSTFILAAAGTDMACAEDVRHDALTQTPGFIALDRLASHDEANRGTLLLDGVGAHVKGSERGVSLWLPVPKEVAQQQKKKWSRSSLDLVATISFARKDYPPTTFMLGGCLRPVPVVGVPGTIVAYRIDFRGRHVSDWIAP